MPPLRRRRRAFISPPSPEARARTDEAMPPLRRCRRAFISPPSPEARARTDEAMPPLKRRRRAFISPPSPDQTAPQPPPPPSEEAEPAPALPAIPDDLLPEIAARSDITTLVRCAACCRSLRAEILRPAFIRRVCRGEPATGAAASVPPFALGFLHAYDEARIAELDQDQPPPAPCFTAAHPATPGVASFFENHLAPFVARTAGKRLLGDYEPLASRNGLVVLRRRYLAGGGPRRRSSEMCVYDPMSGGRTFLPSPPDIVRVVDRKASDYGVYYTYALLTAADGGIGGGSFLVLAADFTGLRKDHPPNITVQTVSSGAKAGGRYAWCPATTVVAHPGSQFSRLQPHCDAVVLSGRVHWLMYNHYHFHILTYDLSAETAGSIGLPKGSGLHNCQVSNLHLGSSPEGRLSLHVANKLKISVWLLPPAGTGGDGWSLHAVIDIGMAARSSLAPPDMNVPHDWWLKEVVDFASSGVRSGAILLRPFKDWFNKNVAEEDEEDLAVLDVETKELRRVIKRKHITVFPYEIDLEARLKAMKAF